MCIRDRTTSGKDMTYYNQEKNERYIPYVVERCV